MRPDEPGQDETSLEWFLSESSRVSAQGRDTLGQLKTCSGGFETLSAHHSLQVVARAALSRWERRVGNSFPLFPTLNLSTWHRRLERRPRASRGGLVLREQRGHRGRARQDREL